MCVTLEACALEGVKVPTDAVGVHVGAVPVGVPGLVGLGARSLELGAVLRVDCPGPPALARTYGESSFVVSEVASYPTASARPSSRRPPYPRRPRRNSFSVTTKKSSYPNSLADFVGILQVPKKSQLCPRLSQHGHAFRVRHGRRHAHQIPVNAERSIRRHGERKEIKKN